MSTIRLQLHSIHFKKVNGLETYFPYHTIFSLIIGFHLGRHLGYIEMLNDARVASLGFFTDNVCTTRINKEKKFKIKFQVLLKFTQILPDYSEHKSIKYPLRDSRIVRYDSGIGGHFRNSHFAQVQFRNRADSHFCAEHIAIYVIFNQF